MTSAADTAGDVLVGILLAVAVLLELFCVLGVVAMRGTYARLHFTGPVGLSALLIAIAILIREGFSVIGNKALFIGVFLLLTQPILAHVTARAARVRERGDLRLGPDEEVESA